MAQTGNGDAAENGAGGVRAVSAETLATWLADGSEIALLDVREEGQHGEGHPLLSVNLPYSRLEAEARRLVPRLNCRIVLVDDGDGVAELAAKRLAGLGYTDLSILTGGLAAWAAGGHGLFESSNVPSKAFAEIIEHELHTPAITAAELEEMRRSGRDFVILDSRTPEEYARFHVPGAISCPGAELVHRVADLVPSPDTTIVVSCAGRTRGIIGAQSLINAGVPNKVVSLSGGTQGWRLGGFQLEHGLTRAPGPVTPEGQRAARERAEAVAQRFGVRRIGRDTLAEWEAQAGERSLHLLDVRSSEEYAAGHLPGSIHAPGGQLVQAIDRWVGTRGARIVLIDDTGVRATMTAHWLQQMGWDVRVLENGLDGAPLETGPAPANAADLPRVAEIGAEEAAAWLSQGAAAVSVEPSAAYRKAHARGAVWSIRPRLNRLPSTVLQADRIVLFAEDPIVGRLAAADLSEIAAGSVALVRGGTKAWAEAGNPLEASPETPPDSERIDYLFWNHDRHEGNANAMRGYLQWELDLPPRIAAEGNAGFRIGAAG